MLDLAVDYIKDLQKQVKVSDTETKPHPPNNSLFNHSDYVSINFRLYQIIGQSVRVQTSRSHSTKEACW